MALVGVELAPDERVIPREVRRFLREAERRVRRFGRSRTIPAFVACDFEPTYRALAGLSRNYLAPGKLFCEWGSGFGVATCLAALLEFDAFGIEIEGELVTAAQQLAADFELPAQFIQGSFIPPGGEPDHDAGDFAWLTAEEGRVEEELGLAVDDFDVIFAYPWPDEVALVEDLFRKYGAAGAVLLTYHGEGDFRLRRKR